MDEVQPIFITTSTEKVAEIFDSIVGALEVRVLSGFKFSTGDTILLVPKGASTPPVAIDLKIYSMDEQRLVEIHDASVAQTPALLEGIGIDVRCVDSPSSEVQRLVRVTLEQPVAEQACLVIEALEGFDSTLRPYIGELRLEPRLRSDASDVYFCVVPAGEWRLEEAAVAEVDGEVSIRPLAITDVGGGYRSSRGEVVDAEDVLVCAVVGSACVWLTGRELRDATDLSVAAVLVRGPSCAVNSSFLLSGRLPLECRDLVVDLGQLLGCTGYCNVRITANIDPMVHLYLPSRSLRVEARAVVDRWLQERGVEIRKDDVRVAADRIPVVVVASTNHENAIREVAAFLHESDIPGNWSILPASEEPEVWVFFSMAASPLQREQLVQYEVRSSCAVLIELPTGPLLRLASADHAELRQAVLKRSREGG